MLFSSQSRRAVIHFLERPWSENAEPSGGMLWAERFAGKGTINRDGVFPDTSWRPSPERWKSPSGHRRQVRTNLTTRSHSDARTRGFRFTGDSGGSWEWRSGWSRGRLTLKRPTFTCDIWKTVFTASPKNHAGVNTCISRNISTHLKENPTQLIPCCL